MPNQYFATNRLVGDGSTTSWPFSFSGARSDNGDGTAPYLTQDDVQVALVVYDPEGRESWEPISFELVGPSTVEVVPAIELDQEFVVYRSTEIDVPVADFTDFSSISERDLDDSFRQTLFVTQEALDRVQDAVNAANSVQGTAGAALSLSNEALGTSQEALLVAQGAESQAASAVDTAASAQQAANQAVNTANSASSVADSALNTANTALDSTETFSDRVDDLQDAVDELLGGGGVTNLMFKDENLSGLENNSTARSNLGVPSVSESQSIAESVAAAAVSAHVAQSNPHPQYGVPVGIICMWSGSISNVPSGWALCNGQNGTPDLRGRFVVGAGGAYSVGATGGAAQVTLTTAQIPAHGHSGTAASAGSHSHAASTGSNGSHSHSGSTNSAGAHTHGIQHDNGTTASAGTKNVLADPRRGGSESWQNVAQLRTASVGAHTHSLSINSGGAHTHSVSVDSDGAHTHSVSVGNTGGGEAHENRPPYYALAYIMKV